MLSRQRDLPTQMCSSFKGVALFVHLLRFFIYHVNLVSLHLKLILSKISASNIYLNFFATIFFDTRMKSVQPVFRPDLCLASRAPPTAGSCYREVWNVTAAEDNLWSSGREQKGTQGWHHECHGVCQLSGTSGIPLLGRQWLLPRHRSSNWNPSEPCFTSGSRKGFEGSPNTMTMSSMLYRLDLYARWQCYI